MMTVPRPSIGWSRTGASIALGSRRFNRDGNHPRVLTVGAGHPDQGLGVGLGDQVEPAVGQALATLGTLKTTRLPAEDVEQIHAGYLPRERPS